ncbi:MAG TPA: putative toxin-antitoxin system toxin component, PIN family [Anaerolineae bacterium]|nr:putative toxin-antitoxin system toxin component, PIN family [Anaerolineae bacterium]HOQ97910.1 putative toxin-antitoxin system toxin component, PIN family [Anaerolineae bacterium]HPL27630.1 putative toxin-antitoxin system toxin component, PIN family [Anaerolineae bacterium]
MIRAVIDTNILIRALIKPQGSVGAVIAALRSHSFELVVSWPLLEELMATVARPRIQGKYGLTDQDISDFVTFLILRSRLVEPARAISACRDSKDNMVLEAAVAGQAQFIVTGDEDLLVQHPFEGISIVPAGSFLARLSQATAGASGD